MFWLHWYHHYFFTIGNFGPSHKLTIARLTHSSAASCVRSSGTAATTSSTSSTRLVTSSPGQLALEKRRHPWYGYLHRLPDNATPNVHLQRQDSLIKRIRGRQHTSTTFRKKKRSTPGPPNYDTVLGPQANPAVRVPNGDTQNSV